MLTIFEKVLLKNEFLKESQNKFELTKNRGKIKKKKNNFIFEILVSKNITNQEQIKKFLNT